MWTPLPFLFHGTSILTEDVFLPEGYLLFLLPGALVPQIFMLVPSCHSGLRSNVTYLKRSLLTSPSKAAFTWISSLSTPLFCSGPLTSL